MWGEPRLPEVGFCRWSPTLWSQPSPRDEPRHPQGSPNPLQKCCHQSPSSTPPRNCRVVWGAPGDSESLVEGAPFPHWRTHTVERGWVPCWPVWSGGLSWLGLLYLSPCTCAWSRAGPGSPSSAPDWRGGWVGSVHACSLAGWVPAVHLCPERGPGSSRQSSKGAGSAGTEPQPGLKPPAGCVTLECHR